MSTLLYRLGDDLLYCILKTVVRESCLLVTKCQTVARDDFQKLLSTVPVRVLPYRTKLYPPGIRSQVALSITFMWLSFSVGGLTKSSLPHGCAEPPS